MPIGSEFLGKEVDDSILKRDNKLSDQSELRWWLVEHDEKSQGVQLAQSVHNVAKNIHTNLSTRRMQNYLYAMMYNDIDTNLYASMNGKLTSERFSAGSPILNRITFNVVQNGIDTAAAMICKNRPDPLFLSDGAKDWSDHIKAEKLTKYVRAVMEDCDVYRKMVRVFTDGGIYGTGVLKFYADYEAKKIKCDWCFIDEILIDDMEGFKEKPSQLHQRKWVSRDELMEEFPEFADAIRGASSGMVGKINHKSVADMIPVLESWHLKSGLKAKDGRHVISIENAVLFEEQYDKDYYPFVFWRWYHQSAGFWGRGIAQEIGKIQRTINKIANTIDQAQDLMAQPLILSPKTAMISDDHLLSNAMARLVEYYGDQVPQFLTPPAVQQELYNWIWVLEQKCYNYIGISQGMAEGRKPEGLESGEAIREATDLAAARLLVVGQEYEDTYIDIAKLIVNLSKDLAKAHPDLNVIVRDNEQVMDVKFSDVNMEEDRYNIHIFEVSGLPAKPEAKLDMITKWGQNGWIPKEVMMGLLNIPELESYTALETSTNDLVRSTIGKIKEDQVYTVDMKPIPEMLLELAFSIATMEKVLAKRQGLPDEVLEKIDLYIQDVKELKKQQIQAQMMEQQQMQIAPAAAPVGAAAEPGPMPGAGPSPAPPNQGPTKQ